MISKKLEEALNAQINAEMWSAYLYLSMSAYCHRMGYAGMANWSSTICKAVVVMYVWRLLTR